MDDRAEKRGLQTIGSLISSIASTQRPVDGTPDASASRPRGFEITTPSAKMNSRTGMALGERGSGELTSLQRRAMALVAQAPTGVLHRNPAALLPPCVRSSLAEIWVDGDDDGYGWDGYVIGYELTAALNDGDREQAIAIAEAALWPASEEEIVHELGRLRALTVSRDIGGDLSLVFAAYTAELRNYPAEAIRDVLRTWPKTQRFWPSMAELIERLERLVKPRRALREALKRDYQSPAVSPDWTPPPSEEDKAAVLELLAKHGIEFDDHGRMRPPESEALTRADIARIRRESGVFRLLDENDPRVKARLREMGAAE